jgi:chemotaxis signal transduction protein
MGVFQGIDAIALEIIMEGRHVMLTSTAWELSLGDGLHAAVGEREMLHVIDEPRLFDIPTAPPFCRQVLIWQGLALPVMDLAVLLQGQSTPRARSFVGIVAYQESPGKPPEYGAVMLSDIPNRVLVHDDQSCPLPQQPVGWKNLAIACYDDGKNVIPILDLYFVFSRKHLE